MTAHPGETLGQRVRGLRLGFYWSPPHRAFIRIADVAAGRFQLWAVSTVPGGRGLGALVEPVVYRRWWDDPDREALLNSIGPLVDLREEGGLPEGAVRSWFFDDDGMEVAP